jgi:hypothetical protein
MIEIVLLNENSQGELHLHFTIMAAEDSAGVMFTTES